MQIAVTSQNFRSVTGHAGRARRFIVFEIIGTAPPKEINRLDLGPELVMHGFDPDAAHPLDEMDVLITAGAGEGLVRRLAARGVRVVATSETEPIRAVESFLAGRVLEAVTCQHGHGGQEPGCGCKH